MNLVILIGNVGKDPAAATGTAKGAHFTLATSERWKVKGTDEYKEKTTWHNIQVWGPFADFVMKRVYKGAKIAVHGKISIVEYNEKTYHNIIADKIEVLSPRREPQPDSGPPPDDAPPPGTQADNPELGDDDIPF